MLCVPYFDWYTSLINKWCCDWFIRQAVAGLLADARSLTDIAREEASNFRSNYGYDIPLRVWNLFHSVILELLLICPVWIAYVKLNMLTFNGMSLKYALNVWFSIESLLSPCSCSLWWYMLMAIELNSLIFPPSQRQWSAIFPHCYGTAALCLPYINLQAFLSEGAS